MDIAVRVQAEGATQSNHSDFVDKVLQRVAALARNGEYTSASAEIDDALSQAEAQVARLLARGAEVALLDGDTSKAATLMIRQADADAGGTAAFETLRGLQDSHYEIGRNKALNLVSRLAIDLAQLIVARATDADERGAALNDLGLALQILGERDSDTARLEQAATAYRDALKQQTRDRVPMEWAMTQNNLGTALQTLGNRDSDTARLEQAVTAYHDALKERTRDRAPMDWAMTQNNLGNALQSLGERDSGTARLEQVVTAFDNALKELTRDRMPMQWATTQHNLGNALRVLGERDSDTARLAQALTAFHNALKELTRDRVPMDWAMTQENLALVDLAFFAKTADAAHLDRAESHAENAQEVYVRAQAGYYINKCEKLLTDIKSLRDAI